MLQVYEDDVHVDCCEDTDEGVTEYRGGYDWGPDADVALEDFVSRS